MQEQKKEKIMIPKGRFEGYCEGCFYGKAKKRDSQGRILCKGEPGGYHFPSEKNDCRYYTSKISQWIKIIVGIWFVVGSVQLFMEFFLH